MIFSNLRDYYCFTAVLLFYVVISNGKVDPQLGPIRQITPKKIYKIIIHKVKQRVYIGGFKGAEFINGLYFVLRPFLNCVGLIYVRDNLNLAKSGG